MIIKNICDFVFPKRCLNCGSWGEYICYKCLNKIKTLDSRICPMCNQPSLYGLTHPRCKRAFGLDGLTSIYPYQGLTRKAIQKLKFNFITDLADTILDLFLTSCGEDKAFTNYITKQKTLLIPVPLHQQRKKWRGFNQAELLGEIIAQKLGIGFTPNLLTRVKKTSPQTKLSKKERFKNIKGAFEFNQQYSKTTIKQSNLILFDDVWTTGATLRECTKMLKRVSFKNIWGLTLARQV